jgi:hypothetical protein
MVKRQTTQWSKELFVIIFLCLVLTLTFGIPHLINTVTIRLIGGLDIYSELTGESPAIGWCLRGQHLQLHKSEVCDGVCYLIMR